MSLTRDRICLGLLLLATVLNAWPRRSGPIDLRWDAAKYYVLGTSLAQGHGYRLLSEPGEIEEVQYPPGTSVLIALHEAALGSVDPLVAGQALKFTWFAMYVTLVLLTYVLLRGATGIRLAFVGALLAAFTVHLYFQSSEASADLPFALASCGFVMVARQRRGRGGEAAAAALAVISYFLRTVGLALFAAWIADGLWRRQYARAVFRSAVALACVLAWSAHIRRVENSEAYRRPAYEYQRAGYQFYNVSYGRNMAYVDPFQPELGIATPAQLVRRFLGNAALMPQTIGESVGVPLNFCYALVYKLHRYRGWPEIPPAVFQAVAAALGIPVIAGMWVLLRRGERLIPIYFAFTAAAICAAPWPGQMTRYAAPLLPFFLYAFFSPALKRISGRRLTMFALGLLTVQFLVYAFILRNYSFPAQLRGPASGPVAARPLFYEPVDFGIEAGLAWIADHSGPDDIIAMTTPQRGYLRTGRKSVMPPLEIDPARFDALASGVPVRYLLLERNQATYLWKYAWAAVSGFPDRWKLVFASPDNLVLVYERLHPAPGG